MFSAIRHRFTVRRVPILTQKRLESVLQTEICSACGAIRSYEIYSHRANNITIKRITPDDLVTPENRWKFACRTPKYGSDATLKAYCTASSIFKYCVIDE